MNKNGFTLLEVLIVMMIIGIITFSVGGNWYQSLKPLEQELVISQIVSELEWSRMMALLNDNTYYFRIYSQISSNYKGKDRAFKEYYMYYINEEGEKEIAHKGKYPAEYILYRGTNLLPIEEEYYDHINFTPFGTARNGSFALGLPDQSPVRIIVSHRGRVRVEGN